MSSTRLYSMPALFRLAIGLCALVPTLAAQRVPIRSPAVSSPHADEHSALPTNCQAQWLPTFGGASGIGGPVKCFATFDDGSGTALYVGGQFQEAGGLGACG